MAQGNDVVDLTGLMADKFLESAQIIGTDLVLTMNDGEVLTIDLNLAPDIFLDGAVINAQNVLLLTMNDGTTHEVDLSAYATVDTYVQSAAIDGLSGLVTLTMNDGSLVTFNISTYVENAEITIQSASYNCALDQIEIYETDGNMTAIDMTCFSEFMASSERGGVLFDSNKSYVAGDIVTLSGESYISITGSNVTPTNAPNDWARIHIPQTGGGAWDNSLTYEPGDMVTKNNLIYIAQTSSTNDDPSAASGAWREFNSVWHVAQAGGSIGGSLHNPFSPVLDAYPDATVETLGAMWYVDGLGEGVTYTFVAGTLAGITVKDKDRIVWASGTDVAPNWVHIATATISVERGGVAWSSSTDYVVGDIVTDPNGYGYKNILAVTANGVPPASDTLHWVKAFRGGEYDSTLVYEGGDIISYQGNVYIAPAAGIGPGVEPGTGAWLVSDTEERGGIAWNTDTKYEVGDMVSQGTLIYTALTINDGKDPSVFPGDWQIPNDPNNVERGGIAWSGTTAYLAGDMVISTGGEVYGALIDHSGFLPENSPTQWKLLTKELGGIAHDATSFYIAGDMVTETIGAVETMFIAKVDNNGVLPSSDANTWEMVVSATTYTENGGTEWLPTTAYNAGDMVTQFAGAVPVTYVALVPNINDEPVNNLDTIWELMVPTERGGRDWKLNIDYLTGDVVSEAGIVYQAIASSTGVAPAGAPATWQIVDKAGSLWNTGTNYEIGDLASENGTIYVALTDNAGLSPVANPLDWQAVNGSGEYDPGINYKAGDIVSYNNVVYLAITDSLGGQPDNTPLEWQRADRGGELWDATTNYLLGDVATQFNKAYVALSANTGNIPDEFGDTAFWKLDVVTVEDVLTSTSAINALSANMGRDLEDRKIEHFDYGTPSVGGTAKYEWDAANQILNIVTV